MFGIGPMEALVILLIIVVIFGGGKIRKSELAWAKASKTSSARSRAKMLIPRPPISPKRKKRKNNSPAHSSS